MPAGVEHHRKQNGNRITERENTYVIDVICFYAQV